MHQTAQTIGIWPTNGVTSALSYSVSQSVTDKWGYRAGPVLWSSQKGRWETGVLDRSQQQLIEHQQLIETDNTEPSREF